MGKPRKPPADALPGLGSSLGHTTPATPMALYVPKPGDHVGATEYIAIPNVCAGCGSRRAPETPCGACGHGKPAETRPPEVPLPMARNAEEREVMLRRIVAYACATGDQDGAARALATGMMVVGSEIEKAMKGST